MKRTRRTFTKEFKQEAVRLVLAGERSVTEIAESLDIGPTLLSKWVRAVDAEENPKDAFRGQGNRREIARRNHQLEQENRQLKMELEFLKKVSRYFAQEDPK